jgi:lactate racemase
MSARSPLSSRRACCATNLDYLDPAEVDPTAWAADSDTLIVPDAGEDLYRLR